jgi:ubiquitin-conjugating enzyme E2 T
MAELAMSSLRLGKELRLLESDPPPGVSVWPEGDLLSILNAQLEGPLDTPYEKGSFHLRISVSERYPLEPPQVLFLTRVYHPNIDDGGRICLSTLHLPPKGVWGPQLNIRAVLISIQQLLTYPNPDDPLVPEITREFRDNYQAWRAKAALMTAQFARSSCSAPLQPQPPYHIAPNLPSKACLQAPAGLPALPVHQSKAPIEDTEEEEEFFGKSKKRGTLRSGDPLACKVGRSV